MTVTKAGPTVTVTKQTAKDTSQPTSTVTVTDTETVTSKPVEQQPTRSTKPTHAGKHAAAGTVVFKVWGTAPSGADVTYGSDSDNRQGPSRPGFPRSMKAHEGALYYDITAQLQGGAKVHCSVTIGGQTKTRHASGGYNICSAPAEPGSHAYGAPICATRSPLSNRRRHHRRPVLARPSPRP